MFPAAVAIFEFPAASVNLLLVAVETLEFPAASVIVVPVGFNTVVFPAGSVAVTLFTFKSSLVAIEIVLPFCVTAIFLPASIVTVSPALTASTVVPDTVPFEADVVTLNP